MVEFLVYRIGNWDNKCKNDKCKDYRLVATFNGVDIEIETWENEYSGEQPTTGGSAQGITWTKEVEADSILKFIVHVPSALLTGAIDISLDYTVDQGALAIGIDQFEVTLYSNSCPAPTARRHLIESMRVPGYESNERSDERSLGQDVEADECQCVCPALAGENPAPGSGPSAPKVLDLYVAADGVDCAPQGTKVGSVTLVYNKNGTVTATYEVDPKYQLKSTTLYVGDERLPGSESGDVLPISQFPYTGSEVEYNVDPLNCDYYVAAAAEICGEFPTLEPTSAPTSSPTAGPTSGPTGATLTPTASPTSGPTSGPTGATLTPTASPTAADRNAPTPAAPPKPTPAKPTPAGPAPTPGTYGDPHIMTFASEEFDFHAACDTVLLDNPNFRGVGMRIHTRTKLNTWWSYVEAAAIQIGDDVLEVKGGDQGFKFWVNGVEGRDETDIIFSPLKLKVHFKVVNSHQLHVRIDLKGDVIGLQTYKQFVKVTIPARKAENYLDYRWVVLEFRSDELQINLR
ncbi:expressed unknown protein [Seminavis robusta]|uniref:VWFD domain-containing protein n=1 Tax=Seminavis robusta TaxID=568900 RepID=A0A9N8DTN1_9STRA|nr:expressed unknown protein [Seminavis robusta]|eukprot:Sro281_g107160.1 n/a (516) ;mRNA; f:1815-3937